MFRVARKIRVGRETGNTHIFFFWPKARSTAHYESKRNNLSLFQDQPVEYEKQTSVDFV